MKPGFLKMISHFYRKKFARPIQAQRFGELRPSRMKTAVKFPASAVYRRGLGIQFAVWQTSEAAR
jgi:hypothetical protein